MANKMASEIDEAYLPKFEMIIKEEEMGEERQTKKLRGKSIFKHELEVDWLKSSYKPDQGEMVVYDIEVDADGNILELPEGRSEPYTH
jgi:hypothetical protein